MTYIFEPFPTIFWHDNSTNLKSKDIFRFTLNIHEFTRSAMLPTCSSNCYFCLVRFYKKFSIFSWKSQILWKNFDCGIIMFCILQKFPSPTYQWKQCSSVWVGGLHNWIQLKKDEAYLGNFEVRQTLDRTILTARPGVDFIKFKSLVFS